MPIKYTQQERKDLLAALGVGRPNAVSARQLAQILRYPISSNQVKLRGLIKECIENDGDLIGAATGKPAGFFLISSLNELEAYLDSLEKRTISDNDRRTALLNTWNSNPANTQTNKQTLTIK